MLFEKEHYGFPISEKLSEYIKSNTSNTDMALVSAKTGVSLSTIGKVRDRTNSLTEKSSVAIIELMRKAIENCKTKSEDALRAKKYLEDKFKSKQSA